MVSSFLFMLEIEIASKTKEAFGRHSHFSLEIVKVW
jgi:hypothetical protein